MTKEALLAFRKSKNLSPAQFAFHLGLNDEKQIVDFENGTVPMPEFVLERFEVWKFTELIEFSATCKEDKLDQLLNGIDGLPTQGKEVINRIEDYLIKARDEADLWGLQKPFWLEFKTLFQLRRANTEVLKMQLTLFQ